MTAAYHAAANNGAPAYVGDVITTNEAWADALVTAGLAEVV